MHTWEGQQASQERVDRRLLIVSDMKDEAQESTLTRKEIGVPKCIFIIESCTQISLSQTSRTHSILTIGEELVLVPSTHNYQRAFATVFILVLLCRPPLLPPIPLYDIKRGLDTMVNEGEC